MIRKLTRAEKNWVRAQVLPTLRKAHPEATLVEVVVLDETDDQGSAKYQTMVMGPIVTRRVEPKNP